MKRNNIFVWIVSLAMLVGLTGCAGKGASVPVDDPKLAQAKEKLLGAWIEAMEADEQIYSTVFQMLDYVDAYTQDNSWESLLKARAVSNTAVSAICQITLPKMELSEEETELLLNAGIEVNAVQLEHEKIDEVCEDKSRTARIFFDTLEHDVFLSSSVEKAIPDMTAFYRSYYTLECRSCFQFTNYLLLQMDSADEWQSLLERFPCMAACADGWYTELTEVEAANGGVLDEMQRIQSEMGRFLGISEDTLRIVEDARTTGDMAELTREINVISGVPGYFPNPDWDLDCDTKKFYLVTDPNTQEKRLLQAGESLDSVPSACCILYESVALEDVQAYAKLLGQWGIAAHEAWDESKDTFQVLANSGKSAMMIEWSQEKTLLHLTEPIGCLIPQLYLYAMTVN